MKRLELARLLTAAKRLIRHRDFVIVGSLSILGATLDPPEEMVGSIDVDLYPKADPAASTRSHARSAKVAPFTAVTAFMPIRYRLFSRAFRRAGKNV